MSETITSIIDFSYKTILPLLLGYAVRTLKEYKESKNTSKQADMLVLRLILVDLHDRCIKQGYISNQMYITFNEVWDLYSNKYNGNHLTKKFKNDVDMLPTKSETWED